MTVIIIDGCKPHFHLGFNSYISMLPETTQSGASWAWSMIMFNHPLCSHLCVTHIMRVMRYLLSDKICNLCTFTFRIFQTKLKQMHDIIFSLWLVAVAVQCILFPATKHSTCCRLPNRVTYAYITRIH